ncbi:hypothetical protein MXB_399 [Myxobolus squamalis]|nr:hypothetical protein MXB_399 [Myxobolus squamalis]
MDRFKLNSPLPSKETKTFKKAIKCYDQKNYKNGIKYCKQILSNEKCYNHVDTLSILSLMLHFTGKNEEAIKMIKLALSYNLKSSVSWHSYGIIHKNNHCYEESAKCFILAIKFDQENTQLLLELGTIQIHQKDYQNAVISREKLLKVKNGQRQLWLAYIVSLQLAKKNTLAMTIMKNFTNSIMENKILCGPVIIPRSFVKLLKLNPENKEYYHILKSALDCKCSSAYQKIIEYLRNVLMPLYENEHKVVVIETFLLKLQEERSNDPNLVWILFCLAQHFNYQHLFLRALHLSELVTTLAPDFIDGFLFKGIVCKNLGRISDEIECASHSHGLDMDDRNVKIAYCTTLLKYNQIEKAEEIVSVYTSKSKPVWKYMQEIQFLELFQKMCKMYFHKSDINRSLNICLAVENFFTIFLNSLMDFHMYSMKKATIIPYLSLHENFSFLRQNNIFYKVARTAIKCCLTLIYTQLNDTSPHSSDIFESPCLDPYEHIQTFLTPLLNLDSNQKNYYLAFEYYYISGKILLMLKVLSKIIEIAPNSPKTAYCKIIFGHFCIIHYQKLVEKCSHDIVLRDFPTNDHLSCLYRYKIDMFLGYKQFNIDIYTEIFNISIQAISHDWIMCYQVYKEFVFSKEALGIPKIRTKFITQLMVLFPGCYLDKRIDDAI